MSRATRAAMAAITSFPRVSGGEPSVVAKPINFIMFSPRERG